MSGIASVIAAVQDERFSIRVFNLEVVFSSNVRAFLYVILNLRDPGKQKFPHVSVIGNKSVDWYEDRPWVLPVAAFSAETPVSSDRSSEIRFRRSSRPTGEHVGESVEARHQEDTFSP